MTAVPSLSPADIESFVETGYVHVRQAFPRDVADEGRALLWKATGLSPDRPDEWSEPVVRLAGSAERPFAVAANTDRLRGCFDQLVGPGRWVPRTGLGTFPVRFPTEREPDDLGWHCDGSFGGWPYRLNVGSRGRALLMLFLFSDVGVDDAPTRIRVGSHLQVPAVLAPAGDEGMTFLDLAANLEGTSGCTEVVATGQAGDVYLCHPFLVHAAQVHRGTRPRFIAQPPLEPAVASVLGGSAAGAPPVEIAIRRGLAAA